MTLSPPPSSTTPENSPMSSVRQDLTRIVLAAICLLLLIGTTLWVLRPFLAAGVWATMLVVSTWPRTQATAPDAYGASLATRPSGPACTASAQAAATLAPTTGTPRTHSGGCGKPDSATVVARAVTWSV